MAKFCSNCGAPLEDGSKFCEQCGTPVDQANDDSQSVTNGQENGQPNWQGGQQYGPGSQYGSEPQYGSGPQYGPEPQYQPGPSNNSKTGLIVGLIIAAAAAVALIVFLVSPVGKNLLAKKGDNNVVTSSSASAKVSSDQTSERSSSQTSEKASSSKAKTSSSKANSESSSARTSSSRASQSSASSQKPAQTDFASLSTTAVPEYSDFLWFLEDVYYNGAPAAKKVQKDYSALMGSWKALGYIDPDNRMESSSYDYSTYTFSGTEDFAVLETKRYSIYLISIGQAIDTSGEGKSTWHGKFENGSIHFDGPGALQIDEIYTYNGREYALGHYYYPSGENGPIALVRP